MILSFKVGQNHTVNFIQIFWFFSTMKGGSKNFQLEREIIFKKGKSGKNENFSKVSLKNA